MHLLKKRMITLIEIIVVITIIGLLAGALAYNMGGALEKGKASATELTIRKLQPILETAIAEGRITEDDIDEGWKSAVATDPLVDDPNKVTKDGWGREFQVTIEDGRIQIRSDGLENYKRSQGRGR